MISFHKVVSVALSLGWSREGHITYSLTPFSLNAFYFMDIFPGRFEEQVPSESYPVGRSLCQLTED